MNYKYESKTELRNALRGRKINNIEFGGGSNEPLVDEREIALHLDNHETVLISATTFQTLKFEEA